MKTPLVIIDMQVSYFESKNALLLSKVVKHVQKAMKRNAPIIVLEFLGQGKTQSVIMELLRDYGNYSVVGKKDSDGSKQVTDILREKWGLVNPVALNVCGIYTTACVAATVDGLVKNKYKVNVILEACDSSGQYYQKQVWGQQKNVKVIYPTQREES